MKVYQNEKDKLKKSFKKVQQIALTSDCWTSNQSIGYLCVTAHFIDEQWNLQHRIISFLDLDLPHTANVIADAINRTLLDWGIHKKIITITLDNAKASDVAALILKRSFENTNRLYFGGKFFHVRCCAHVLNLIVQDSLKRIDDAIAFIRNGIAYIRKSPSRLNVFAQIAHSLGVSSDRRLYSDVKTRWNSTYHMLDVAFHYRFVLHDFF
ncbi:Putative AC9 transposase [Apostasia shenzhenica]|uniref:AC9 transposase n=1 Tax=Apostasia shenzhenica TaxID=1088818 RepID=A0A2I0BEI0_9ASPA|nr:Putative AC9 transposase [Apostasia shenzhenica]